MQTHFDYHPLTHRFAIQREHPLRGAFLSLLTHTGQELAEIAPYYLPLTPRWSPDGERIAFAGNDGVLYQYRLEWQTPKPVFQDPVLQAGFCEWSPDGRQLVFSAFPKDIISPPNIYLLDVNTDQIKAITSDPKTVDRFPQWSPHGKWIAFHREDPTAVKRMKQIYRHEVASGRTEPLLNHPIGSSYQLGRFGWHPTEAVMVLTHTLDEKKYLEIIHVQDRKASLRIEEENISGGAFSPSGNQILCVCQDQLLWLDYPSGKRIARLSLLPLVAVRNSWTGPQIGFEQDETALYFLGEDSAVYRWEMGKDCRPWVQAEPDPHPEFTTEEYHVSSHDGREIPVIRFIPPHPKPVSVLFVHGGPGETIDPNDPFMLHWITEGIEFVCPAYRGSDGYGSEHRDANRGEYGRADVWDLLAVGLDWQKRFGEGRSQVIIGCSYGGFLTGLAIQQENIPWVGGVALWPVSSLSCLPMHLPRALPLDPVLRDAALIERSPLLWPDKIRVPFLIFHGALDTVARTEELINFQQQSQKYGGWCKLFVYEDDTHGLRRHRAEIHQILRTEFRTMVISRENERM
jgi:dipeptidyl aminopeptidase/acylaminoacyl peptidase